MQIVSPTEDVPSTPSSVETTEDGLGREVTNFNLLKHPVPRSFDINDKFIPNALFDLSHMPLFLVEHFIIMFNPDGPKGNAPQEVPNLTHFAIFPGEPFPNKCLLPVEAIVVAGSNPAEFMHESCLHVDTTLHLVAIFYDECIFK